MEDGVYEFSLEGISNGIGFGAYFDNKGREVRTMVKIKDLEEAERIAGEGANNEAHIGDLYQIEIKDNKVKVTNHLLDILNEEEIKALDDIDN